MSIFKEYNLSAPFRFFEEFAMIPHGSGDMERISNYCKKFAEDRGHRVIQDSDYNVIVFKKATPGYEDIDTIILQGHLDMVCEKVAGSDFDFKNDSLKLMTDGVNVWADGTTLGADNGIAIAMMLAILDDESMEHGPLEMVMTVDEENGLNGAASIDLSVLEGKKLINLDSEEDHMILTSCAGGAVLECEIPVITTWEGGATYKLVVEGLLGGHSGIQINEGLGNAHQILGRVLLALDKVVDIKILGVTGGKTANVIPNHASITFFVENDEDSINRMNVESIDELMNCEIANELVKDSNVRITAEYFEENDQDDFYIYDEESKNKLINLLVNGPNGVQKMSESIEGLVETSLNFGVLSSDEKSIKFAYSIRSSVETSKQYLLERTKYFVESLGGSAEIKSQYPGWEFKADSDLREAMVESYEKCFGEKPEIGAIHAGLECGLLADKIEGLDCVSIGPNLKDVHSVKEIMEVASVEKVWTWLQEVLKTK